VIKVWFRLKRDFGLAFTMPYSVGYGPMAKSTFNLLRDHGSRIGYNLTFGLLLGGKILNINLVFNRIFGFKFYSCLYFWSVVNVLFLQP
jgi:hypothetical protein